MKIKLVCRACDSETLFDDAESAKESDWFEIAAMGGVANGVSKHRAYCPEYPFDR